MMKRLLRQMRIDGDDFQVALVYLRLAEPAFKKHILDPDNLILV